jgi:beta-1,4-mannosyl-glycoprotein beta-1,4-N-acetylglucosaminyltransferase
MKIYDCFMFMNELELLELRLMTLYYTVDYFVLIEAGNTHSCTPKPFYFEENREMFSKYLDKIIYLKIEKLPYTDSWMNENYNREMLINGIGDADPNDYIMVSDVDEIPNPIVLKKAINDNLDFFILQQKLYYYFVNCMQTQLWSGPVVMKRKNVKSTQAMRKMRGSQHNLLKNGGWHYSYLGGIDKIKLKMASYAESIDNNKPELTNTEHILKCLETGHDILNRSGGIFEKKFLKINELDHPEIHEWLKKYPEMIKL